jgi:hypothetical protein
MSTNIKELAKPTGALGRCDPDLYSTGACVAVITGGSAMLIERFVREVADYSGVRVDWHYCGGYARVVAPKDDAAKVREAIMVLRLGIEAMQW